MLYVTLVAVLCLRQASKFPWFLARQKRIAGINKTWDCGFAAIPGRRACASAHNRGLVVSFVSLQQYFVLLEPQGSNFLLSHKVRRQQIRREPSRRLN